MQNAVAKAAAFLLGVNAKTRDPRMKKKNTEVVRVLPVYSASSMFQKLIGWGMKVFR